MGAFRQSTVELARENGLQVESSLLNTRGAFAFRLPQRLALFVFLFAAEWVPATNSIHKGRGAGRLFALAVVFASAFFAFGYIKARLQFEQVSNALARVPLGWGYLGGHFVAYLAFLGLSLVRTGSDYSLSLAWFITAFLAIGLAGFAFVPLGLSYCWRVARDTYGPMRWQWV